MCLFAKVPHALARERDEAAPFGAALVEDEMPSDAAEIDCERRPHGAALELRLLAPVARVAAGTNLSDVILLGAAVKHAAYTSAYTGEKRQRA